MPEAGHGARTLWVLGCRCDECLEGQRRRTRAQRRFRRWKRDKEPSTHGITGYTNYGCRCDTCRAAGKAQRRRLRAR